MDRLKNPFSPGAGTPPPELVGRNTILEDAYYLLARVWGGRPEKSMLLTGLRGVGKTVLLNEFRRMAEAAKYHTALIEAQEDKHLGALLTPIMRTLLFEIDRLGGAKDKVRRAFGALRSFVGSLKLTYNEIEFGFDVEPEKGLADSGDLELDLTDLLQSVAEAASDKHTAVALLIDEVQYFNIREFAALIMALHRIQQRQLPLVLFGAGLPVLQGLAGDSKSYAERLFNFPPIGPLTREDADKAIQDPAQSLDVTYDAAALDEIFRLTKGYPYFLQEWAYVSWNLAPSSPVDLSVIRNATATVTSKLDQNFFRVRFDRLTPSEKNFLRCMAALGAGPTKTADIAGALGSTIASISPRRAKLMAKGMIYSPTHGELAFTVPLFDEFMRRTIPSP